MEDFPSLWTYQKGIELKQNLLYTRIELESVKMEANHEMIKNKENVKNLLNLLQMAYKERDEAKNQLQKVLNKLVLSSHCKAESSPHLVKANSSITESNSLSADQSQSHSLGSPVIDSLFDAGDLYNIVDKSSLVIDNIVKGKKLPQKGRLLQSVMEAGPLLQTLLVAGPLPRWRNPPPMHSFNIPPFLINNNTPRMCSSSMLNFSGVPCDSSCFIHNSLVSSPNSTFGSQFPSAKRQRFQ